MRCGKNRIEALENRVVTKFPDAIEEDLEIRQLIETTLRSLISGRDKHTIMVAMCKKWKNKIKWLLVYLRLKRDVVLGKRYV